MRTQELVRLVPPEFRLKWLVKCEGVGCNHARAVHAMYVLTKDQRFVCYSCIRDYLREGGDPDRIVVPV